jgi:hypothetical protein
MRALCSYDRRLRTTRFNPHSKSLNIFLSQKTIPTVEYIAKCISRRINFGAEFLPGERAYNYERLCELRRLTTVLGTRVSFEIESVSNLKECLERMQREEELVEVNFDHSFSSSIGGSDSHGSDIRMDRHAWTAARTLVGSIEDRVIEATLVTTLEEMATPLPMVVRGYTCLKLTLHMLVADRTYLVIVCESWLAHPDPGDLPAETELGTTQEGETEQEEGGEVGPIEVGEDHVTQDEEA